MSHVITITCDSCGHEEHFTAHYTDTAECFQYLIHRSGWQRVAFTTGSNDGEYREETTTEYYCPECIRYPDAERSERDRATDTIQSDLFRACVRRDITEAYSLCDRLYDLTTPKEGSRAAD